MNSRNPIALKLQSLPHAEFVRLLRATHARYLEHISLYPDLEEQAAALAAVTGTLEQRLDEVKTLAASLGTAVVKQDETRATAEGVLTSFGADAAQGQKNNRVTLGLVFPLRKVPERRVVTQVLELVVKFNLAPGALDLAWARQKAARSYEVWVNLQPGNEAGWVLREISTTSRYTLPGLPSGQKVQVRVRAVGPYSTKGLFSAAVEHLVP